jgi:hypothetical protein
MSTEPKDFSDAGLQADWEAQTKAITPDQWALIAKDLMAAAEPPPPPKRRLRHGLMPDGRRDYRTNEL